MHRAEVLFVGGRAGVGKTSVAAELHAQLAADRIRHCLIEGDNLDLAWPAPWACGRFTRDAWRNAFTGVKSLRLDSKLESRLERVAAATGESLSEFIRQAAAARADMVLRIGERKDFVDVLGVVHSGGGQARGE